MTKIEQLRAYIAALEAVQEEFYQVFDSQCKYKKPRPP